LFWTKGFVEGLINRLFQRNEAGYFLKLDGEKMREKRIELEVEIERIGERRTR